MPTQTSTPRWELYARSGRAVLVGVDGRTRRESDPSRLALPGSLVAALHEWARVVDTIDGRHGLGADSAQLLARRSRQLAMRVALETGGEVRYPDPLSGEMTNVRWPSRSRTRRVGGADPPAPTPWATGLTVSAIVAVIVAVAFVVVTLGLSQVNVLVAVVVNLAVAAGFAPSIRLGSRLLVWRWVAYGAAAGIGLSWIALLFSLLG
jgi:hypothetical protein